MLVFPLKSSPFVSAVIDFDPCRRLEGRAFGRELLRAGEELPTHLTHGVPEQGLCCPLPLPEADQVSSEKGTPKLCSESDFSVGKWTWKLSRSLITEAKFILLLRIIR